VICLAATVAGLPQVSRVRDQSIPGKDKGRTPMERAALGVFADSVSHPFRKVRGKDGAR
jgi:hypothetical protein